MEATIVRLQEILRQTRNIAGLSVFIVGGTMSLNHATTVAFMRPRLSHA
jgi:hypothetical protein